MLVKFRDTIFVGPLYIVYKTSANLIAEIALMIDELNCHMIINNMVLWIIELKILINS